MTLGGAVPAGLEQVPDTRGSHDGARPAFGCRNQLCGHGLSLALASLGICDSPVGPEAFLAGERVPASRGAAAAKGPGRPSAPWLSAERPGVSGLPRRPLLPPGPALTRRVLSGV